MTKDYSDIIHLERPHSRYPRMPRQARAAQFAPFAALSGYEEAVEEASRFVEQKPMLSSHELERINQILRDAIEFDEYVDLVVFEPDSLKAGGTKHKISSKIKKYVETERKLVLQNGREINIENILEVKSDGSKLDQAPW